MISKISKGHAEFNPGNGTFVCANHLLEGRPTRDNHFPHPTLFLTPTENKNDVTPKKRGQRERYHSHGSPCASSETFTVSAYSENQPVISDVRAASEASIFF